MIRIAIGTDSRYKVNAIKKALHELDFEFSSEFGKVDSEVGDQPHKSGEIQKGSINRARNILNIYPSNDLGIAVEFGYEPSENTYRMVCWASIVTKEGKIFSEQSSTLELPIELKKALLNNQDVSDQLDKLFKDRPDSEKYRLFKQYLKKRRVIYESVLNVMMRYLFDKEFFRK